MTEATRSIVVGIDGSEASKAALAWAVDEARARAATVTAVHTWQFPMVAAEAYGGASVPIVTPSDLEKLADSTLHDAIAEVVGDDVTVRVVPSVRKGHPAQELVDASEGADMLVVGSRGHGGFRGMLLGSVSAHVVHHATCTVVVVRPGWKPARPAGG